MGNVTVEPGTQLDVEAVGGGMIRLCGELDIRTCVKLEQVVGIAVDEGRRVVLDLSELTFCDSTGLAGLVRLNKRAITAGGDLVLRDPTPRVQTLLGLTGLDRLFTIETSA